MRKRYDWILLQEDYNSGLSQKDLREKYKISIASLIKAGKRGDIKFRSRSEGLSIQQKRNPRKHTEETKKKISEARKTYLLAHPEKVPYRLNHSSKRSMPELIFENALKSYGEIDFVSEYPMGIYQFDFAIIAKRIDIEIDGSTHNSDNVVEIDKRRDEWSKERGWRVIRLTASDVIKDVNSCLNKVLAELSLPLLEPKTFYQKHIDYFCECGKNKSKQSKKCIECAKRDSRKVERPSLEMLLAELKESNYSLLGKKYGVSDNAIRKWIKIEEKKRNRLTIDQESSITKA